MKLQQPVNYLKHVATGKIFLLYPGQDPVKSLPFGVPKEWASFKPIDKHPEFRRIGESGPSYVARTGCFDYVQPPQVHDDKRYRRANARKLEFVDP